jgi:predicted  nucleic acid-binding Zn-ribbon protein
LNLFELSAKISVDDTNFKKSMENAQKVSKNVATAIKNLQSPLDKAKSGFNAIAHPVEAAKANIEKLKNATEAIRHPIETFKNKIADASTALETKRNKLSALAAGYDSAKKKVDDLTKEFNKSAKESGTSSQKTQELAKKLNEAEKEAEEAKKELDDYSASVSKAGENSDSASKGVGNLASKLGKGLATAGKVAGAALGVAAAGVTALITQSVNSFAEYEQLAGGAAKIFNDMSQTKILKDAQNAYKNLGMSANEYLAVINDVGAAFASTMGDEAGYKAAQTGLQAISDYASGTGKNVSELSQKFTLITRSTSSYQSIADQFSGILPATSEAFLEQAQAAGILSDKYTKLTEVPIAEYQDAVSKMLQQGVDELGLANNTMEEAFSTLSGSLSMAKSAWSNLVTGLSDDTADMELLINNFVESVGAVANKLAPTIGTALNGATKLISDIVPKMMNSIPEFMAEHLPVIAEAAIGIIESIIQGISENQEMIVETIISLVMFIAESFLNMLPQIIQLGLELVISLAEGIAKSIPALIPAIVDVIFKIVEVLTNQETLQKLLDAAIAIITELAWGIANNVDKVIEAIFSLIEGIVAFLLDPATLTKLAETAVQLVLALGTGIVNAIPQLLVSVASLIGEIFTKFTETDWGKMGKDVVAGFKQGIRDAWDDLKEWFSNLFDDLIGIAKKILGINSPSKVFKGIGKWTAEGFGIGFDDEFSHVKDEMKDALDFDNSVVNIGASVKKMPIDGEAYSNGRYGGVSIVQNIYSEAQTAADLMQEAVYQQEMAVYLGV